MYTCTRINENVWDFLIFVVVTQKTRCIWYTKILMKTVWLNHAIVNIINPPNTLHQNLFHTWEHIFWTYYNSQQSTLLAQSRKLLAFNIIWQFWFRAFNLPIWFRAFNLPIPSMTTWMMNRINWNIWYHTSQCNHFHKRRDCIYFSNTRGNELVVLPDKTIYHCTPPSI